MYDAIYSQWSQINKNLVSSYPVLPVDFEGNFPAAPFLLFELLLPEMDTDEFGVIYHLRGQAIYQIYSPARLGKRLPLQIAATLNNLAYTQPTPNLTISSSGVAPLGRDPHDSSLLRHDVSLNFVYYKEHP